MKKLISILLTVSMLSGSAAMPFTAIAAGTSAETVISGDTKELHVKKMELSELYNIADKPYSVPVECFEVMSADEVFTKLCGGEYAGAGSYDTGYFMHTGSNTRILMDKNGRLHKFEVIYPEVVVRMKEGVKLPIDKISNTLADKGYKAPKLANEGDIYRLFGSMTYEQFNTLLEMLQKLPDAVSVAGHLAVYEDTANSISGGYSIRIGLPYEMDKNNENYKELMKVASSVGYKESDYESSALIGDFQLFLCQDDAENRTNPYKLFKYLEDNGYLYSTSITSTELALINPTVYFCNIPYPMNNEPPADLGDETFNKLRDLNADTFKNVFRLYNTPVRFVFSEYSNIDKAFDSKYMNICYYVVEHTDGWFSFYNEELKEYKSARYTIRDGKEVKLPYGEVEQRSYEVYLDSDIVKERISPDVVIKEKYFLSGESNHMGTAVYFKTSAGDYVYYRNYDVGEVFMPVAEFCKLQKAIREELSKYPDDNGGGAVDITDVYDIAPYKLNSDRQPDDDIDFTHGTKTMTLDDVKAIAKKKMSITWADLADFKCEWVGIGMYTHYGRFDLEDGYYLIVEGNPPQKPDVIRLYHKDDVDFIDLRYHDADKFISGNFFKDFCNMTEAETKAYFAERGMTEEKGYRVWTKESAARTAENYFVSFLVKLPASFTDKNGNNIINETADVTDLPKMMTDNSYIQQFNSFLSSFDVNLTEVCNIGSSHLAYRTEGTGEEKLHRRYLQIDAYAMSSYLYTKDEADEMYADALNYIQLNPQFAGFVLESRIPLYGSEDNGKLKGDANNDDQVDMADVVLIMQCLANPDNYSLSETGRANADIDGDGVTVGDAQTIQKRLLGIIDYISNADIVRKMTLDYCAEQNVNYTIIQKEKMPEKFADKYVFYKTNSSDINDYTSIEQFIKKNYIQRGIMREIPYNTDDDSELNLIREKLFCFMLENDIRSLGINNTDKEQDAINKKVIVEYDWNDPKEDIQKLRDFVENSDFDSDRVEFRQSGLE
ncbi:dockerin type I repeat-containing protein [Ruminococcus sp.]|uniref:dockerin type I repeat-containing protein n=1 Tax=Ruminococcus sp. TaxID=41978 RepID=UPI0025FB7762|nr:dockerin type I repeat-containing protein [Ruminococcus sp.]MCR4638787.1 dockerin type I repeat-containing protein [Ruminococcus sp.]